MRRLGATVFLWLSLGVIGALAFGTEGGLNGLGHEHQRITRAALESFGPATLDELAGTSTATGAVGEPDQARGGQRNNAALHCHGADYLAPDGSAAYAQTRKDADAALAACRALIVQELDRAIVSA
ncbi:MAG: hypothetical protein K8S25_07690, partial [Alphaproteobacteria bacterium]|nr:hypothetical protein [Alphaproteobacteria bacterium]